MSNISSSSQSRGYNWDNFREQALRTADSMDKQYGIPARKKLVAVGTVYPFTTTLAVTFGALSFFPVLTFLTFSFFTLFVLLLSGLATALFLAGIIILGACVILLSIISLIFGFALFFSVSGYMVYLAYRFAFHVQANQGQGAGAWLEETLLRFKLIDINEVRETLASDGVTKYPDGKVE
ncbi:unnamed protein product [Rhizoctonia solani]|uniref:Transmembrane protein n=2 Tax=Rhizoctonia solani TaxID=456999 RepID=A0A8H3CRQ3_9AGAM|nr:transmembrane protein, putative [Rhizoctonia solani AG-3 Rhs1AP]CAE6494245.1 unnamed protein product [Rhizoctonia solani]CAE6506191.1 unnamed protein product [Rhizoctonia solani]